MNVQRIGVLFSKEVVHGAKSFIIIFVVIVPILLSLVLSMVFGTIFSGKARLGIVDLGDSYFTRQAEAADSLIFRRYESHDELRDAVERGAVDIGMMLPADFDQQLANNEMTEVTAYVWGESLLKNRALLFTFVASTLREMAGQEKPINVTTDVVGDKVNIPWVERLLPLVVLMAVLLGGLMISSTSLIEEKMHRTLTAVSTTSATLGEVFFSKGLLGMLVSVLMGVTTLALNSAFGNKPVLMLLVLTMSATLASSFGLLMGVLSKDLNSMFATIKATGILLYAPGILYIFPDLPKWISYIFPTHYMISPIVKISLEGGGWPEVAVEVAVLAGLILAMFAALGVTSQRLKLKEV